MEDFKSVKMYRFYNYLSNLFKKLLHNTVELCIYLLTLLKSIESQILGEKV